MKKFSQLISLLPCHTLEEFPERCSRANAKNVLAAWTTPWHPELIAAAGTAPIWLPASKTVSSEDEAEQFRESFIHQHYYDDDHGGADLDGREFEFDAETFAERWRDRLIIIPTVSKSQVFSRFEAAVIDLGATVVSDFESRSDLLTQISVESSVDDELVNDFFALAYVRLQVELMTRKLRFSSDLDVERFNESATNAAQAAAKGDEQEAKRLLQASFDLLTEEKNQYYPVAADLVDMVLLSDAIRSESISAELKSEAPKTFVMTGSTLQGIADRDEQMVTAISDRLKDGSLSIAAGPQHELPDDLLSLETCRHQLQKTVGVFDRILAVTPQVFMRRRAGLHSSLPAILKSCGFNAAVHATIDQGEVPATYSNSMRWMGADGSALMAVGETPLDAANEKSFLELGVRIGRELDSAHVSTVFLARWPTQKCDSFEDLRNATKYGNILGDFTDADSYFENVYDPGYGDEWEPDEYIGPWFEQAVGSGSDRPISTFIDYWRDFYLLSAARNLLSMLAIEGIDVPGDAHAQLDPLQERLESQTKDWTSPRDEAVSNDLKDLVSELVGKFGSKSINIVPWRRTAHLVLPAKNQAEGGFKGKDAVKFAARNANRCDAVVALSGFGQLYVDPESAIEPSPLRDEPAVDDKESILRNEHFEVRMDRRSGGIRGVHFYGKRGNLLTQKLSVRQVDSSTKEIRYSDMVCESFEVVRHSRIASEVRSSGSLVAKDGTRLATFKQTVGLQRGRNVIDIDIELSEVSDELSASNYIANRIAWSDETGDLFCDMQGARHAVRKPKIEAPHYVEVVQGENRFALLTKGLPWHRRASSKKLDSILVAGNEARRKFQLGIAINPESSMQLAVAEIHSQPVSNDEASNPWSDDSKWLLHLANRNLIVTSCETVANDAGEVNGLQIRFQETEGTAGTLKLYCKREIVSAEKQSLDGEHLRDITLQDETQRASSDYSVIETSFAAKEYFQVQLSWA